MANWNKYLVNVGVDQDCRIELQESNTCPANQWRHRRTTSFPTRKDPGRACTQSSRRPRRDRREAPFVDRVNWLWEASCRRECKAPTLDLLRRAAKKNQDLRSLRYQTTTQNMGKGHYYENHNVENQKEHRKICKPSLHRKSLFSWSLLRHHYGITTLKMAF